MYESWFIDSFNKIKLRFFLHDSLILIDEFIKGILLKLQAQCQVLQPERPICFELLLNLMLRIESHKKQSRSIFLIDQDWVG